MSNSREGTYQPGPISHGNKGTRHRHNSSALATCQESIREFIQRLADDRGEPYATRFIRERTSIGLREEEDGTIELPSSVSKRQGNYFPVTILYIHLQLTVLSLNPYLMIRVRQVVL